MICKKCGCRVSDTAAFCDKCGAPMAEFGQPEPAGMVQETTAKKPTINKKYGALIVAVVVALLAITGFLLLNKKNKPFGISPGMTENRVEAILGSGFEKIENGDGVYFKGTKLYGRVIGELTVWTDDDSGVYEIDWTSLSDGETYADAVRHTLGKAYGTSKAIADDYYFGPGYNYCTDTQKWYILAECAPLSTHVSWLNKKWYDE